MKKLLISAGAIFIVVTSCIKDLICIDGNGNLETQSRMAASFNSAVNTTSVDVIYLKADSMSITVRAESNIINHILTITENDRLEIRTDPANACFDYNQKPVVTVTAPELRILKLTGSGNLSADSISGNSVEINLTGSGDFFTDYINCSDLAVITTGSGDAELRNATCQNADFTSTALGNLRITGTGENGNMRITGSGDIDSDDFPLLTAIETITGSGNIYTDVRNSLKAVITGSGNIYLIGSPAIDQTITGSGKIIRR
jgi:hypothetical protein